MRSYCPMSTVLPFRLVSGWGSRNRRSVPHYGLRTTSTLPATRRHKVSSKTTTEHFLSHCILVFALTRVPAPTVKQNSRHFKPFYVNNSKHLIHNQSTHRTIKLSVLLRTADISGSCHQLLIRFHRTFDRLYSNSKLVWGLLLVFENNSRAFWAFLDWRECRIYRMTYNI